MTLSKEFTQKKFILKIQIKQSHNGIIFNAKFAICESHIIVTVFAFLG